MAFGRLVPTGNTERFNVTVTGEERVDKMLAAPHLKARNFKPAFDKIRNNFADSMRKQFPSQGAYLNKSRWAPLNAKYAAWKAKHYPGKTILRRTDRLFRSLTGIRNPEFVYETTPTKAFLGSRVPYAIYHQAGTEDMPRRRIIMITKKMQSKWTMLLSRHLASGESLSVDVTGGQ